MGDECDGCKKAINCKTQIKTLRIINCDSSFVDLWIKTWDENCIPHKLNLDKKLKNLTILLDKGSFTHFSTTGRDAVYQNCVDKIAKLLRKEIYYNLQNVNILIESTSLLDGVFDMLKKNCKKLHHQFKQLNIGMQCTIGCTNVLEWHQKIDEKFIDNQKEVCASNVITILMHNCKTSGSGSGFSTSIKL